MTNPSGSHGHTSRKTYLVIFLALAVLTVLELWVAGQALLSRVALVLLALIKAGLVGWYFMHLGTETRALQATVAVPFVFPALYAFVLIAEAAWRLAS